MRTWGQCWRMWATIRAISSTLPALASMLAPVPALLRTNIGGIAVLEYGRAEIFPPVGAISSRHACLCRPHRLPRPAHPREKPGFWVWDGEIPRDTDSPLEGTGFELAVPRDSPGAEPISSQAAGVLHYAIIRRTRADTGDRCRS